MEAPPPPPAIIEEPPAPASAPPVTVIDDSDGDAAAEESEDFRAPLALPSAAPVVAVPPGPEPGDVLRVQTDMGIIHVAVPQGANEGTNLRIEGVVEVRVPLDTNAGDLIGVQLPDKTTVTVELLPEDANPGQILSVAFPVTLV